MSELSVWQRDRRCLHIAIIKNVWYGGFDVPNNTKSRYEKWLEAAMFYDVILLNLPPCDTDLFSTRNKTINSPQKTLLLVQGRLGEIILLDDVDELNP